ncbi:potassium voltage-gated channel protein Shaw-like [Littorina saxatilis]|uniref:potassium voltage-gated channel protein Shaw-like n=1 Tax=Littorina saxatilis TaxID=31220 RepID=UPI0038B56CC2
MDSSQRVTLNVGGKIFMTTAASLQTLPNTRLGRLVKDSTKIQQPNMELFFDRNPKIMNSLLDFYRTGELHLPKNICGFTVERELQFWEIPVEIIHECCYKCFHDHKSNADITREIDTFLTNPYERKADMEKLSSWNKIWLIMERPNLCRASKMWSVVFFSVVFMSVLLCTLETSMTFREFHSRFYDYLAYFNITQQVEQTQMTFMDEYSASLPYPWLRNVQEAILVFFVLEFTTRLVTCPQKRHFLQQAKNWFDLLLIVHNGLSILLERVLLVGKVTYSRSEFNALLFFYALSVLRVMRIFYLAKNFDTMKILLLSTRASLKVFVMLAVCVLSLATMFGASVWLAELVSETFSFSSVLSGMWYAIITMTTVGYGDVVPVSVTGKLIGALCALCGVVVMALPIAVIASKFTTYHDNLVTREQLRKRITFSKTNLHFFARADEGEKKLLRTDKQYPPLGVETHRQGGHSNTTNHGVTVVSVHNKNKKSSCFKFGLCKQKLGRAGCKKNQVSESRTTLEDCRKDLELSDVSA